MQKAKQDIESEIKNLWTKVMKLERQGQTGKIFTNGQNIRHPDIMDFKTAARAAPSLHIVSSPAWTPNI